MRVVEVQAVVARMLLGLELDGPEFRGKVVGVDHCRHGRTRLDQDSFRF